MISASLSNRSLLSSGVYTRTWSLARMRLRLRYVVMMFSRMRVRRRSTRPEVPVEPVSVEPVDGVFEVLDDGMLLCLADDLTYPVRVPARRVLPVGGFLTGLLSPGPSFWSLTSLTGTFPGYQAAGVANLALRLLAERPRDAFRNPELVERGWELQRAEREAFVAYFGTDTLILPPAEAGARLEAFRGEPCPMPAGARTVGVIYDDLDGLLVVPELATVRSMFSYPALATDPDHARTLRGYLSDESITPAPLRRLARTHPETVDEVFRAVLAHPEFSWSTHGETLLREYKPAYFSQTPHPATLVIADRLAALL
jgi:hypothetical protein